MSAPNLVFGCATIGASFTRASEVSDLLDIVSSLGVKHLDTAARYPPTAPGLSEKLLGEAGTAQKDFTISSKIYVSGDGGGDLTAPAIDKSLQKSLASLETSQVDILYCHAPDNVTPLEEQAAAFDAHFKEGKFKRLGVSNFSVEMIERWMAISIEKGYVKPSVYQGQYNLFCRGLEKRLFPTLQKFNMSFVAFSPLAGGFLTGKLTRAKTTSEDLQSSRFREGDPFGSGFRYWYDKDSMHQAITKLGKLCETRGISTEEASLRWVFYHSALKADDGVIFGASKLSQVHSNTTALSHGPLDGDLASELDALWLIVEADAISINP